MLMNKNILEVIREEKNRGSVLGWWVREAGRWYRPGHPMIPDPLSVDVVTVLSADEADEVPNLFAGYTLK